MDVTGGLSFTLTTLHCSPMWITHHFLSNVFLVLQNLSVPRKIPYYLLKQKQLWVGIVIIISFHLFCPWWELKAQVQQPFFYIYNRKNPCKKTTSPMCGCLLPCTCVESARVLHVQTKSRQEAEKRKAESQDLRAHRKTAVWSQTRSARPPHTADELCPHCRPPQHLC